MLSTPAARALWERLVQWQPATAAALAEHLRAMPGDWPLRVFGVGRAGAALALPPGAEGEQYPDREPEIAPYDDISSFEDCPACGEAGDNCRFHAGHAAGHHQASQPQLDAVKIRPYMPLQEFLRWQADVSEAVDRGETPPELIGFVPPAPDPDETDEQRADREETEREHAAGDHEHCGVTCEAEFTAEKLRNGILWRAAPGSGVMLDELLRRARAEVAAPSAPASTAPLAAGLPHVQGRCPACGTEVLFLGNGGYVTCSLRECPEPDAASTVLERQVAVQPADAERRDRWEARMRQIPGWSSGGGRIRDAAIVGMVVPDAEQAERHGRIEVWPLKRVLTEVRCGSQDWSWDREWADLDKRHAKTGYLAKLEQEIHANGITMPVLIGSDGRLWDGHHRLRIAVRLGIDYVPVEITAAPEVLAADEQVEPADCSADLERQVKRLKLMVDEYGEGASALTDKLKRVRDLHRETCPFAAGELPSPAFKCGMCEVLDAPAPELRRMADEAQQTEPPLPPETAWRVETRWHTGEWRSTGRAWDSDRDWVKEGYDRDTRRPGNRAYRLVRAATTYTVEAEHTPEPHVVEARQAATAGEGAALPLLFWDESAGVAHEDGRITAWISRAVSFAQSVPAGQLILQMEAARALRRALTTALNDADEARQADEEACSG